MSLPDTFHALYLEEGEDGPKPRIGEVPSSVLPEGEVLIRVSHSTINYKDAMMVKGVGYRIKDFPFVPGIDLAGEVVDSSAPEFQPGDAVVLNGYGAGEQFAGGYASYARARADWLIPVPGGWTPRDTMAVGTAGMTAMLSILELEKGGITPERGAILVTGASGGLGSMAIAMLSALGYRVEASTGRTGESPYLQSLGAAEVIPRAELEGGAERPLMARRWAGCIDAVGGATLSTVISSLEERGVIASCGLAGGNTFTASLIPFFLRGVRLIGIEGGHGPIAERREAWARIPEALSRERLEAITTDAVLGDVPDLADDILAGRVRGRISIDVNA
ncbi:MAG TPA: MDR family oxidoreductase [Alphaproteobacteria bacterium]|nr:MDR family oxidoreductase [Alphaproteobacteria bacterium]